MGSFLIYFLIIMIIPMLASSKVRSTYKSYSKVPFSSNLTGAEVARKILDENGLHDVAIEAVKGELTDHYDPRKKIVRLSVNNYQGRSIAAASVAAHEVGHAIQDAESYAFLNFRTALVPLASFGSNFSFIVILAGLLLSSMNLLTLGVIFMAFAVLFQLVTLPVEFNASSRAMDQLVSTGILTSSEERGSRKVLNAAAMTYVAGALVALMELLRFILIIMANRD